MDNLFYEKYLKYKAKYLALGGGYIDISQSNNPSLFDKIDQFYKLMNAMFIDTAVKDDFKKLIIFDSTNKNFKLVDNFDYTKIVDVFKNKILTFGQNTDLYDRINKLKSELETNKLNDPYFYNFINALYILFSDDFKTTKKAPPQIQTTDDMVELLKTARDIESTLKSRDSGSGTPSTSLPSRPLPSLPDSGSGTHPDSGSGTPSLPDSGSGTHPGTSSELSSLNCKCDLFKPMTK